ncbi:MAG: hypothetical protein IJI46_07130 [Erysipelotrichaceae bacterium]|nr:hypothetical protein [Erysipelotrichaceae bacterium]
MGKTKSLKTYLKVYGRSLSGASDFRLRSMIDALKDNPRAEGPVLLYAALFLPEEKWVSKLLSGNLLNNYLDTKECLDLYSEDDLVDKLPYEEAKALQSYYDYKNQNSVYCDLKKAYCNRIKTLIDEKSLTLYRICRDNDFNQGNFHSFLKGNFDRLSIDKCERVYQYLCQ